MNGKEGKTIQDRINILIQEYNKKRAELDNLDCQYIKINQYHSDISKNTRFKPHILRQQFANECRNISFNTPSCV